MEKGDITEFGKILSIDYDGYYVEFGDPEKKRKWTYSKSFKDLSEIVEGPNGDG